MATDEINAVSEHKALFAKLIEPFDPSEIKWRVTHTTQDRRRGAVIALVLAFPRTNRKLYPACLGVQADS